MFYLSTNILAACISKSISTYYLVKKLRSSLTNFSEIWSFSWKGTHLWKKYMPHTEQCWPLVLWAALQPLEPFLMASDITGNLPQHKTYWPFEREIEWWLVDSPDKGIISMSWRGHWLVLCAYLVICLCHWGWHPAVSSQPLVQLEHGLRLTYSRLLSPVFQHWCLIVSVRGGLLWGSPPAYTGDSSVCLLHGTGCQQGQLHLSVITFTSAASWCYLWLDCCIRQAQT